LAVSGGRKVLLYNDRPQSFNKRLIVQAEKPNLIRRQGFLFQPRTRSHNTFAACVCGKDNHACLDCSQVLPHSVAQHQYGVCAMKDKVIHCRVTEKQHKAIKEAAEAAGISITAFVVRAALSGSQPASH